MKESKTNLKLTSVESVKVSAKENVVDILFDGGIAGKLTFLEENIFRYDVDPKGVFAPYATPRDEAHTAKTTSPGVSSALMRGNFFSINRFTSS